MKNLQDWFEEGQVQGQGQRQSHKPSKDKVKGKVKIPTLAKGRLGWGTLQSQNPHPSQQRARMGHPEVCSFSKVTRQFALVV
jgi:hypothetical protein